MTPRTTTYQTQKQFLRDAISEVSAYARSLEELKNSLADKYGIGMKESRGRFSYLHPELQKYITGRKLGSHFEKDYLLGLFAENARPEKDVVAEMPQENSTATMNITVPASTHRLSEYDPSYDYQSDPIAILFIRSNLRLVVDLQTNIKAQQSAVDAQKVEISNLKEMARTVCYIQEQGYDTREDLSSKLDLYDAGITYIKEHFAGKVPSLKALKAERDQLLQMKDAQSGTYQYFKDYQKELRTASANVDTILGIDHY